MAETKQIPGPLEYHGEYEIITAEDGGRLVAENVQPDYGPLLAAAPKMAEAIRATLDQLDYLRGLWGDEGVTRTLCDALRSALVEADGTGAD